MYQSIQGNQQQFYGGQPQQYFGQSPQQIIGKIVQAIQIYHIDPQQLFNTYDQNRSNTIGYSELSLMLRKIDPNLLEIDFQNGFKFMDKNGDQLITYQEFIQGLESCGFQVSQNYNQGKPNNQNSGDMKKAEEAIRKLLYSINYYKIDIKQLFQKYDSQGNNSLDLIEFGSLLRKIDPQISQQDISYAFLIFDSDGSGTIDFNEFYTTIMTIQTGQYQFKYTSSPYQPSSNQVPQGQPQYQQQPGFQYQSGYQPQQQGIPTQQSYFPQQQGYPQQQGFQQYQGVPGQQFQQVQYPVQPNYQQGYQQMPQQSMNYGQAGQPYFKPK